MDSGWRKPLDEDSIDNQRHLLHGVIRCNGCVNGIEGGSKVLSGKEIWIYGIGYACTNLRIRKVAVEDAGHRFHLRIYFLKVKIKILFHRFSHL